MSLRNVFILPSQCFSNRQSSSDQQLSARQLREIRLGGFATVAKKVEMLL